MFGNSSKCSDIREVMLIVKRDFARIFESVNMAIYNNRPLKYDTKSKYYYKLRKEKQGLSDYYILSESKKDDYTFIIERKNIKILDYVLENKKDTTEDLRRSYSNLGTNDKNLYEILEAQSKKEAEMFVRNLKIEF